MSLIVPEVMKFLHNFFELMQAPGEWRVNGSALEGPVPLQPGCWIAIRGAGSWDGEYLADENGLFPDLPDGSFEGTVWLLNPPKAFLNLCDEIEKWSQEHPRGAQVSYDSYARGAHPGWEKEFASRLRPWRKMFPTI